MADVTSGESNGRLLESNVEVLYDRIHTTVL